LPIFTVHHAKTNLSGLIKKATVGEEIIIARGDKPVVRLLPLTDVAGKRKLGSLKSTLHVGPEFFAPLPPEELAAWE
jgi:antitoxin (DNA-binding transcriptional repressor) of toxin-antitoxin stability system